MQVPAARPSLLLLLPLVLVAMLLPPLGPGLPLLLLLLLLLLLVLVPAGAGEVAVARLLSRPPRPGGPTRQCQAAGRQGGCPNPGAATARAPTARCTPRAPTAAG
jgi:hypothetical protein